MHRARPRVSGDRWGGLRLAATLALAVAALAAGRARAQSAGPSGEAARPVVLFSLADLAPEIRNELRDALLAQFTLLAAEPRFETDSVSVPLERLGERMASEQQRARDAGAIAVFWLDTGSERWFVHMMDIANERLLVRPVDAGPERRSAAIEAVAVMARESTRALLEGAPLPLISEAPRPPAGVAPSAAAEPRPPSDDTSSPALPPVERSPQRPLQLWAAYHGDVFTTEQGLENGVAVGAAWFGFMPIYLGARFLFMPELVVAEEAGGVAFNLKRTPFGVAAGFRQQAGIGAFDLELGFLTEVLRQSQAQPLGGATLGEKNTGPRARWLYALAPRVRAELAPAPFVSLFAALGMDILLNSFEYQANQGGTVDVLLHISRLRPVLELGLAFYP